MTAAMPILPIEHRTAAARYTVQEFLLTYGTWQSMKQRCSPTGSQDRAVYVDRGITVHETWKKSFATFIADVGPRPNRSSTLDRYPNRSGNYEPGNVRWATATEQAANTRSARLLTMNGATRSMAGWARRTGLSRQTISTRLANGWSVDEALTTALAPNPEYTSFANGRARGKKLTASDVSAIVAAAKTGTVTGAGLGREYGVSGTAICHVLKQFGIRLKTGRPARK